MNAPLGDARSGVYEFPPEPRIKYALFVPEHQSDKGPPGLLATVHSTERDFMACRDRFEVWARQHHQVILAPLFPPNLLGDANTDGYKVLFEGRLRYDAIFNQMVDAVARRCGIAGGKLLLHGYSGGAQFAHRYLLLHPKRLLAVSLSSPGDVTALDDAAVDWPGGTRGVERLFGTSVDLRALRAVPLQMLVGDQDTDISELGVASKTRFWTTDLERRHAHRIARLRMFAASLAQAGIDAQLRLMPGVGHGDGGPAAMALSQAFFERWVARPRSAN